MKRYNSKIDKWMLWPIVLLMGAGMVAMLILKVWVALIIMLLTALFIAHIFSTTFYQIDYNILRVKSGFITDMSIDIMTVKEIAETRDAISSPALSFDRLYIKYNRTSDVIVSPEDKEAFIKDLLDINPSIKIVRKQ